jgi:hypothetical protein
MKNRPAAVAVTLGREIAHPVLVVVKPPVNNRTSIKGVCPWIILKSMGFLYL